jgi:hypothetical protein
MSLAHLSEQLQYTDELRAALASSTARLSAVSITVGGACGLDQLIESNRALLGRDPRARDTQPVLSTPELPIDDDGVEMSDVVFAREFGGYSDGR